MRLNDFDLSEDPFPIVPDGPVHNWAGREDLKEDLLDLVQGVRARDIGVTEFAVLHGELGAGKSHALRFLKTRITDESAKPEGDFRSLAIYIERPRVANKLNFLELQRYIIRQIGRDRIAGYAHEVHEHISTRARAIAAEKGMPPGGDLTSFRSLAVEEFRPNDRAMVKLLDATKLDDHKLYSFLLGEAGAPQGDYEQKVDSDFMAAKAISDLFRILTSDRRDAPPILESIYLFIDESELLLEAKASESELVFAGLREMINGLPYRFCLILSFSAATALIEALMPTHLIKRMTRHYIEVPTLSDDEAVEFVRAQLNTFRDPASQWYGTFYPFTEEAVRRIVANQNSITPRTLFMAAKRVLERALRKENLQPGDEITEEMADSILMR
ncbi:hypothetical protein [uncultured Brevundimonas sp.]|uniref:hypothetical protein n=1 Tax=uncultured Brevundimonas sp. TaxID=213418 RepID=UPI0025F20E2D|nr:hypothetical protein [uncultured Brevundimonas sp.]